MLYTIINILSGLGIFLFGMTYMESALKEFAGVKFKQWLKNSTSSNIKAIFTGASATALLQSSGVVSLMALSFVSASLITLQGAIGLIFGANIGTTATAWIVAILGFKIKIETFALPLIGFSGIILMFSNNQKLNATAKIFIGFGLLFFGLEILKDAIETFSTQINISNYTNKNILFFLLLGIILTTLIQSSSATTAIVLSAINADLISFEIAAAIVIGSNIGSTSTALLGSIGGVPDKKRVALAHFMFNLITAVITFLSLNMLTYFILDTLHLKDDPTIALAVFHSIFNILGVLMLSPFISVFTKVLDGLFNIKKILLTKYIHLVEPTVADGALVAVRNEISDLFIKSLKYALLIINIKPTNVLIKDIQNNEIIRLNSEEIVFDYKKGYDNIKEIEGSILLYLNKINQLQLTQTQSEAIDTLYGSLRETVYAAKVLKDIKNNISEFVQSDIQQVFEHYNQIRYNLIDIIKNALYATSNQKTYDEAVLENDRLIVENKAIIRKLTRHFQNEGINEKMLISLLNTNRTVMIASTSFIEAARVLETKFAIDENDI